MKSAAFLLALVPLSQTHAQGDSDSTVSKQKPIAVLQRHQAGVTSAKFSPDGSLLATSDLNGQVILWRTGSWTPARILNHGSEVYAIAFSPDGKTLASSGDDHKIILWNALTGKQHRTIANNRRALCVTFAPNGELLFGGEDGVIHFVDPATGKETRTFKADGPVWSLSVSADNSTLATALPLRVWDYRTLKKRSSLRSLGQLGVALFPDGKHLASAESTGGALLWNLGDSATYVPLRTTVERRASGAKGFESFTVNMPVASIDLSPSADRIVGGGTTGLVYVWTLTNSQPSVPLKLGGHTMTVTTVAFSPSGEFVASGSLDRTIRIWRITRS
ncbi:MAG: WD40 repeat domain-containing protein [Gemmatimonadaceae bacterium]